MSNCAVRDSTTLRQLIKAIDRWKIGRLYSPRQTTPRANRVIQVIVILENRRDVIRDSGGTFIGEVATRRAVAATGRKRRPSRRRTPYVAAHVYCRRGVCSCAICAGDGATTVHVRASPSSRKIRAFSSCPPSALPRISIRFAYTWRIVRCSTSPVGRFATFLFSARRSILANLAGWNHPRKIFDDGTGDRLDWMDNIKVRLTENFLGAKVL